MKKMLFDKESRLLPKIPPGVVDSDLPAKLSSSNEFCPLGWIRFSDSCYFVGQNKSWTNALTDCKKMGGNLAAIHSQEENDFVFLITRNSTWFGLMIDQRRDDDGDSANFEYIYNDHSDYDFSSWPAKWNPEMGCAQIDSDDRGKKDGLGKWRVEPDCDLSGDFLCKKPFE